MSRFLHAPGFRRREMQVIVVAPAPWMPRAAFSVSKMQCTAAMQCSAARTLWMNRVPLTVVARTSRITNPGTDE